MAAIDAADLAMLADSFRSAMASGSSRDTASLDALLRELGWADVLAESPLQAIATAFELQGSLLANASLLDDVVLHAVGLELDPGNAVLFPVAHRSSLSCAGAGPVDGIVSARIKSAKRVLVVGEDCACWIDGATARMAVGAEAILDPSPMYRMARGVSVDGGVTVSISDRAWDLAVARARTALAYETIGVARTMLSLARAHAVDRVQFTKSIASFQAIRTRLAETFVAIEGAAAVANAVSLSDDWLTAACAKSVAGVAAKTAAKHAQQVLAGIGFTTDHAFQQHMKRALVLDTLFGSSKTLPAVIGEELVRRGHAPRLIEL